MASSFRRLGFDALSSRILAADTAAITRLLREETLRPVHLENVAHVLQGRPASAPTLQLFARRVQEQLTRLTIDSNRLTRYPEHPRPRAGPQGPAPLP